MNMKKRKWIKHRARSPRYKIRSYYQRHIKGKRGSRRRHYGAVIIHSRKPWGKTIELPTPSFRREGMKIDIDTSLYPEHISEEYSYKPKQIMKLKKGEKVKKIILPHKRGRGDIMSWDETDRSLFKTKKLGDKSLREYKLPLLSIEEEMREPKEETNLKAKEARERIENKSYSNLSGMDLQKLKRETQKNIYRDMENSLRKKLGRKPTTEEVNKAVGDLGINFGSAIGKLIDKKRPELSKKHINEGIRFINVLKKKEVLDKIAKTEGLPRLDSEGLESYDLGEDPIREGLRWAVQERKALKKKIKEQNFGNDIQTRLDKLPKKQKAHIPDLQYIAIDKRSKKRIDLPGEDKPFITETKAPIIKAMVKYPIRFQDAEIINVKKKK